MNFYEILLNRDAVGEGMTHFERLFAQAIGGSVKELSGVPPLTFKANGQPLIDWSISGQTVQASTPTPSLPVAVEGVGTLSGSDYIIPVTCGGQTTNIYLGSATSTRRVKKLVLTGEEDWTRQSINRYGVANFQLSVSGRDASTRVIACTHYEQQDTNINNTSTAGIYNGSNIFIRDVDNIVITDFKLWLQQQYANGTPVTVWYILATEETAVVNEPLMKIGTYADEITKTGTGVNIPTVNGSNTLTVGTTVQPSNVYIKYHT